MAKKSMKGRRPNRTKAEVLLRDELGYKQCVSCAEWLPESSYYPAKQTSDKLKPTCKLCEALRSNALRHNISPEQYKELVQQQDNKCGVCETPSPQAPDLTWNIDHDHSCCPGTYSCGKCIRGLLCRKCNMGIGLLGDNLTNILRAAQYLEKKNG